MLSLIYGDLVGRLKGTALGSGFLPYMVLYCKSLNLLFKHYILHTLSVLYDVCSTGGAFDPPTQNTIYKHSYTLNCVQ